MAASRRQWITRAAVVLAAGALLTVLAPYQSDTMAVWMRALYWGGLIAVGMACGEAIAWAVTRGLPDNTPTLVHWLLISLAVSVPVTALVLLIQAVSGGTLRWADLPVFYFLVWVISAAMTALGVLLDRTDGDAPQGAAAGARFMRRLKPKLRTGTLWAVVSEDHYLRVKTDLGEDLILMRLADALGELAGVPGLQTHRSWWVAEAGVDSVKREPGGRAAVTLKDGAIAPVSRANTARLREAGWL